MNEEVQLDAIKDLANLYSTLHMWDKVLELAEELEKRVDFQLNFRTNRRKNKMRIALYPIFSYEAYAILLKASVSEKRKQYREALEYTDVYENIMNEFQNPTREEQELIERFKGWAEGNRYLYNLMLGNIEVLGAYLNFLDANPKEILTAFVYIAKAANQWSYNIDHALNRFENYIIQIKVEKNSEGTYNEQSSNLKYILLFYELAKYRLNQNQIEKGIEHLITSFERSVSSNDDMMCIKCIDLYGKYRDRASKTQEEQYTKLIDKLGVPTFRA